MASPRIVVVTGANRGIGQAICKFILARPDVHPLKLFAASRRGVDSGLPAATEKQVLYPKLDVASRDSIKALASEVSGHGKVDVLINNAGVNLDAHYGYENAKRTLQVNYHGTLEMCRTFLPLMAQDGRIVNLSSVGSSLKPYSETIQQRFRNPNATQADLDTLAEDFLTSVRTHTENDAGFGPPARSYSLSKALVNALTALLAREHPAGPRINCCCPGWIATDMGALVGSGKLVPPKSPELGAVIPVRLGFGDVGGVSGKYWANESVRGKGEGEVQGW